VLLTVVTYHYVRPIAGSRFPGLKGLDLVRFRHQLAHLCHAYTPVSLADVIAALTHVSTLPPNAVLLTFDDAYADHYRHVFPLLADRQIPAVFYPVASAVLERRLLDVNKVHFVLACEPDLNRLVTLLEAAIDDARTEFNLSPLASYRQAHWRASPYDPAEAIYVKRMLQHALPAALRARITGELFRRYVTADERTFADDLYFSLDQLRLMVQSGMSVGGHGYDHFWMNRLSNDEQECEIDRSLAFLARLGVDGTQFTYAYPYGAYDRHTLAALAARGCRAAFTTEARVADLGSENPLALPRLRTNDLPSDDTAGAHLPAGTAKDLTRWTSF